MNGVLIINKEQNWTSQDVCARLRGVLHEKRIGHGGTLDPMATGVLPVFVGRATRAVEFAVDGDKEYVAEVRLGVVTTTQDIWGDVVEERAANVTRDDILRVLPEFTGEILQTPPMYSAIKIDGKRLYDLARRGVEVERQPRPVTIHELELLDGEGVKIRVRCSKGTYVRTLCHDVGERLGCGAAMASLVRTRAAGFTLRDAATIGEVEAAVKNGSIEGLLRPVDGLFADLPRYTATLAQEKRIRNGGAYTYPAPDGRYRVYSASGEFLMLGEVRGGVMETIKNFFEV